MKKGEWTKKILIRYVFLQIPGIVILSTILFAAGEWIAYPVWINIAIISLWLIKDVLLFPHVWHSYDPSRPARSNNLIGGKGITNERLNPEGMIRVGGELWRARLSDEAKPVEKGEHVIIKEVQGLVLIVDHPETQPES
ncbi:MAG: NfeD family protein [Calditrichaceae bacterium]